MGTPDPCNSGRKPTSGAQNRATVIGNLLRGRYRLEERIGSGGMSTVYRAFDETLERWVAIKVLHQTMEDDPVQLERFRREARTVARLSHPNVVTVIDAGEDDGHPFIVFEYVDGDTLKALIRHVGPPSSHSRGSTGIPLPALASNHWRANSGPGGISRIPPRT